jgi:hypothetical protein
VVALRRTAGDDQVRATADELGQGPLELADLVAAPAETDQVVTLDPEVVRTQTKLDGEPPHRLQRGRERPERQPVGPGRGGTLVSHGPSLEPSYGGPVDPADAAELARRIRAAVVQETPRRRWVLPAVLLLVVTIAALLVMLLA